MHPPIDRYTRRHAAVSEPAPGLRSLCFLCARAAASGFRFLALTRRDCRWPRSLSEAVDEDNTRLYKARAENTTLKTQRDEAARQLRELAQVIPTLLHTF